LKLAFRLRRHGEPWIRYADLKQYFAGKLSAPTLHEVREAVRQIRSRKGMLITPGDEDSRSAGSFFKNPVVSPEQMLELQGRAAARSLQVPTYPALDAQHKVSAAWLVEHSGFSKGHGTGRVGISRKHALAIVNRGSANAAEIVAFQDDVRQQVKKIWDIDLQPEPVFVGF
jgi:UDP-N-acetylmuramate dehydrogenase